MYEEFNEKIARIGVAKSNIKQSLIDKGLTVSDNIEDYANLIKSIETGSGSGDVKLFTTKEDMDNDSTAKQDDLALIYAKEQKPLDASSTNFQYIYFEESFTLSQALADGDYAYASYKTLDGAGQLDVSLSSYSGYYECMIMGYIPQGEYDYKEINFNYTSEDGLTWIRSVELDYPYDFTQPMTLVNGVNIDILGNFMSYDVNTFDGIYKYNADLKAYELAPTQLTLDNPNDLIEGVVAYGSKGVIVGDGSIWDVLDKSKMARIFYNEDQIKTSTSSSSSVGDTYTLIKHAYPEQLAVGENFKNDGGIQTITISESIQDGDKIGIILNRNNNYSLISPDGKYGITTTSYVSSGVYKFNVVDIDTKIPIQYTRSFSYGNGNIITNDYLFTLYIYTSSSSDYIQLDRYNLKTHEMKTIKYTFTCSKTSGFQGMVYDSISGKIYIALCPYGDYSSSGYKGTSTLLKVNIDTFSKFDVVLTQAWTNKSDETGFFVSYGELSLTNKRHLCWYTRNREKDGMLGNSDKYRIRLWDIDTDTLYKDVNTMNNSYGTWNDIEYSFNAYSCAYTYETDTNLIIHGDYNVSLSDMSRTQIKENEGMMPLISYDQTIIYFDGIIFNEDLTHKLTLDMPNYIPQYTGSSNTVSTITKYPISDLDGKYIFMVATGNYVNIRTLFSVKPALTDWDYFIVPIGVGQSKGILSNYEFFENPNKKKPVNKLNIYCQQDEPIEKTGLWLKANKPFNGIIDKYMTTYTLQDNTVTTKNSSASYPVLLNVGHDIYMFGGTSSSGQYAYKYNIDSKTYTKLATPIKSLRKFW